MHQRDAGVADLVSTSLLILMSIGLMTAITAAVLPRATPDETSYTKVVIEQNGNTLRLVHDGGEAVPLESASLVVRTDTGSQVIALASLGVFLGPSWDPGEVICVSGTSGRCLDLGGETITAVNLVRESSGATGAQTTTAWTGSIVGLSPPSPAPDLRPIVEPSTPTAPAENDLVTFKASIVNDGSAGASNAWTVTFEVDGTLLDTLNVGALPLGETATVTSTTWSATPGLHTLRITVDAGGAVPEESETNNVALVKFTVPG